MRRKEGGRMAGYVLHLKEEESVTLSAATLKRLIGGGNGDAALLYLCLLYTSPSPRD